ncbi:zinc-binding protein A33-like isoform X1 [Solea senegalensis]|uniref:Zinc-binding protein A33-like isoform X1 n=1 Tax=Solea senegalensis TaxID=28829 RepID=A0AAV6RRH6_SOLSE|nr:E3 ubiquitin-protein ligase TRIM35-like [Solea senegalensis]XP_043904507.1 E3 ubiquitin-protein ligase TRIM35-like [Solea senegalensis]KAG7508071.1 zinc-binding protein A33-like isoform X1 [Solea senegalensis]KAG7526814.1 zinc-binding protein A33-like isoform X1 [Solea senegalensis]
MAASPQSEAMCTCPVCCDIFTEPVVLLCGHSFCQDCLKEWWRQSTLQTCPVCMQVFPMAQLPRNLALKDLSDTLRQKRSQGAAAAATLKEVCSLHGERFRLFCQDDQQLICLVCRDAQKHKTHTFLPINEAAEEHRTKLLVELMHLKSKLGSFKEQKLVCDEMSSHVKFQAQQTEKKIKEDFQKLYQFLRAEEAARVDAVRKEAALKSDAQNIRTVNLTAEISLLTDKIQTIERELKTEDFSFMLNVKSTLERSQCKLPVPETPSGALVDEGKHLGNLLFTVWMKMKHLAKYSPVTLDPNTSGEQLILSENLTCLSESAKSLRLPSNPERCGCCIVLGRESFSSGIHSWDAEVEGFWALGVAARTKEQSVEMTWGIYAYGPEDVIELNTEKHVVRQRELLPKKMRVQLDYDKGILSFFDLERKVFIHLIKHRFTGPVFPYFRATVKILPTEVSMTKTKMTSTVHGSEPVQAEAVQALAALRVAARTALARTGATPPRLGVYSDIREGSL